MTRRLNDSQSRVLLENFRVIDILSVSETHRTDWSWNPGQVAGWMCQCGVKLATKGKKAVWPTCQNQYRLSKDGMEAV